MHPMDGLLVNCPSVALSRWIRNPRFAFQANYVVYVV